MKLHIGCGTVYLEGYVNVDVPGTLLASDRPDLVEKNRSTVEDYYGLREARVVPDTRPEYVADVTAEITALPFENSVAEEVRAVQVFEHLTWYESEKALREFHRVLRPGGVLHMDVPDVEESIGLIRSAFRQCILASNPKEVLAAMAQGEFAVRHVFGSRRGEHFYHHYGYSYASLSSRLSSVGFSDMARHPNIHSYPAFAIEAKAIK